MRINQRQTLRNEQAMLTIALADGPTAPDTRSVYFPLVVTPSPLVEFTRLLTADPRQERPTLTLCPMLVQAATWRAHGLANGDPFAHVDAEGVSANEYARRAGCVLPADYAARGNNVESLVAGTDNAVIAFAALAGSEKHAPHLFGRGWFRHQRQYGIALATGGRYGWYWCVMIASCGESSGE